MLRTRKKLFLAVAILGIIIILFIVLIISPLFKEIKRNSEDFVFQKEGIVQLNLKIENLRKSQNLLKNYQDDFLKTEALFIDPETPVGFIEFLEKIAEETNLSIRIAPASLQKIKEDIWSSMNFQVILTGFYPDFSKFIEKLEAASYLIETQNLAITKKTSEENIKAVLLMKVYTKTPFK